MTQQPQNPSQPGSKSIFAFSEINLDGLPRLDLPALLLKLADQLMEIGKFQSCEISHWNQQKKQTISLVEKVWAHWKNLDGDIHDLKEYTTSKRVLTTGEVAVVQKGGNDPEEKWMTEEKISSLLMLPLYETNQIVGLVEIGCSKGELKTDQDTIQACQEALREASSWIVSSIQENPKSKVQDLICELIKITNGFYCTLSAWDKIGDRVITVFEYIEATWDYGEGPSFPVKSWELANQIIESKRTFVFNNQNYELYPDEYEELDYWGFQCGVIIPLSIENHVIGLIELYDVDPDRDISPEEIILWEALASQAAIAIQNTQLFSITQQKLYEQIAIQKSSEYLLSSLSTSQILERLGQQMCLAIDATSAYICEIVDYSQKSKVIAEFINSNASEEEKVSDVGSIFEEIPNENFIAKMKTGHYDINHISDSNLSEEVANHMKKYGAKSILYIPLIIKDDLIGFTELWESRNIRHYTPGEIEFCINLSRQAAIAIETARLFELAQAEIQERVKAENIISQSLAEKEILLQEIHHRVKNNLQIVSSLLSLQTNIISDKQTLRFFQDTKLRINSIALVHKFLYSSEVFSNIEVISYLESLVSQIRDTFSRTNVRIQLIEPQEEIIISLNKSVTFGLLANEIITNAYQHAFPNERKGTITLQANLLNDDQVEIIIQDDGVGFPDHLEFESVDTLGLQLVNTLVNQLGGTIVCTSGPGVKYQIIFNPSEAV